MSDTGGQSFNVSLGPHSSSLFTSPVLSLLILCYFHSFTDKPQTMSERSREGLVDCFHSVICGDEQKPVREALGQNLLLFSWNNPESPFSPCPPFHHVTTIIFSFFKKKNHLLKPFWVKWVQQSQYLSRLCVKISAISAPWFPFDKQNT